MASLVYHAGALGDFITTLPAMSAWRRLHPAERIVLLGIPGFAALAAETFDETWDAGSARFAPLFARSSGREPQLEERFAPFTSALLFSHEASPLAGNLAAFGVRDLVRQDPFPAARIPVVDYHLSLFQTLRLQEADRLPSIRTTAPYTVPCPPGCAALHPGSGSPAKNWPLERFVELARRLEDRGAPVAWVAGPAEEEMQIPRDALAWRRLALPTLAAALSRCALYVGNDSGVTHLAAACGCPTIALFGASDPVVWAPRGPAVRIIASNSAQVSTVSVEVVLEEIRRLLGR